MLQAELCETLRIKVSRLNASGCEAAIADCHETLRVGEYTYSSTYAQKLWEEIDLARERLMFLTKW